MNFDLMHRWIDKVLTQLHRRVHTSVINKFLKQEPMHRYMRCSLFSPPTYNGQSLSFCSFRNFPTKHGISCSACPWPVAAEQCLGFGANNVSVLAGTSRHGRSGQRRAALSTIGRVVRPTRPAGLGSSLARNVRRRAEAGGGGDRDTTLCRGN